MLTASPSAEGANVAGCNARKTITANTVPKLRVCIARNIKIS